MCRCLTCRHSPFSDAFAQQITFPEYTILQFCFHINFVTLQYKQLIKCHMHNLSFLNCYAKVKRNNFLTALTAIATIKTIGKPKQTHKATKIVIRNVNICPHLMHPLNKLPFSNLTL